MPQERIPDKFTVLEKLKEKQSLTFSDFLFNHPLLQWVLLFICHEKKTLVNIKTLNKSWFGMKLVDRK